MGNEGMVVENKEASALRSKILIIHVVVVRTAARCPCSEVNT